MSGSYEHVFCAISFIFLRISYVNVVTRSSSITPVFVLDSEYHQRVLSLAVMEDLSPLPFQAAHSWSERYIYWCNDTVWAIPISRNHILPHLDSTRHKSEHHTNLSSAYPTIHTPVNHYRTRRAPPNPAFPPSVTLNSTSCACIFIKQRRTGATRASLRSRVRKNYYRNRNCAQRPGSPLRANVHSTLLYSPHEEARTEDAIIVVRNDTQNERPAKRAVHRRRDHLRLELVLPKYRSLDLQLHLNIRMATFDLGSSNEGGNSLNGQGMHGRLQMKGRCTDELTHHTTFITPPHCQSQTSFTGVTT